MRFALSVECRDKFLRAVFFGSKMIANYGEESLSDDSKERLTLIQGTVSTSRKAFRLGNVLQYGFIVLLLNSINLMFSLIFIFIF